MAPATTFAIMFGPQIRSCEEEPIYGHTLLAVPLLLLLLIMMVMLFQQSSPSTLITCRICSFGITLALSTSSKLGPPLAKISYSHVFRLVDINYEPFYTLVSPTGPSQVISLCNGYSFSTW